MCIPLNAVLIAVGGCVLALPAAAQPKPFYEPTNIASGSEAGKTTGHELNKTIGCPGRPLLDSPCVEAVVPATTKPI